MLNRQVRRRKITFRGNFFLNYNFLRTSNPLRGSSVRVGMNAPRQTTSIFLLQAQRLLVSAVGSERKAAERPPCLLSNCVSARRNTARLREQHTLCISLICFARTRCLPCTSRGAASAFASEILPHTHCFQIQITRVRNGLLWRFQSGNLRIIRRRLRQRQMSSAYCEGFDYRIRIRLLDGNWRHFSSGPWSATFA